MHYYDFNIADFKSATVHLTRTERSIYRDMLDMYYETEKPLTLDLKDLCRKLIARADDEKEAVQVILDEFFIKTESGYFNDRCDEVIQKYYNNQTAKSLAGKASAAKREQVRLQRLAELNGQTAPQDQIADSVKPDNQQNSTAVEQPLNSVPTESQLVATNQEPITNNQEPIKNSLSQDARSSEKSGDDPNDWRPVLEMLNAKLKMAGANPVSPTTLEQTLVTFNPHYENQCMSDNKKLAKLVTWIKSDQQRAAKPASTAVARSAQQQDDQASRQTDTTKPRKSSVTAGLGGIELAEFKRLHAMDPSVTQQQVIDCAGKNPDMYFATIQAMIGELQAKAVTSCE